MDLRGLASGWGYRPGKISSCPQKVPDEECVPTSIRIINESSLDSHSIPATTDAFTISASDRQYVQLSKQILQYEMKRKRLNVQTMSEQTHKKYEELALPASITSDWRLVLQDSITIEDLRQGCLSLFDQVDSALTLSQTEINHAIRFLKYADMHIERRKRPHNKLLEIIFWNKTDQHTKLISSLINLVSLPSDALRTAALSFFDVGLRSSPLDFPIEVAATGLLPQLFLVLKPHEIPLIDTTIEFHRHLTSIVDNLFYFVSPETIIYHLGGRTKASEVIEPMYQSFCSYLQYLVDTPVSRPDHRAGFTFLFNMALFSSSNIEKQSQSSSPTVELFFGKIQRKMMNGLVSLFGHASARQVERLLQSGRNEENDIYTWVTAFEYLLGRVSKGKTISDIAANAVTGFLFRFPKHMALEFWSEDAFCLTMNDSIVSSSKLDSNALWTLFTPSQPHHAATILTTFTVFMRHLLSVACWLFLWKGWFPIFRNAVDPSKLAFTSEFTKLHTTLIKLLNDHLTMIQDCECEMTETNEWTPELRSDLDELHLAFSSQTKDYIVHLSLHPFALDDDDDDTILDFIDRLFQINDEHFGTSSFREEIRQEMDESARSLSPPPFILTSELILSRTSDEILNIVDRIVALLASDSPLDDDTIRDFRIPQKAAGRSTEQYFHALESLLSLHVNCSPQYSIGCLLSTRPDEHQPTFGEWDDVDFETGLILTRVINQNTLSLASHSSEPNTVLLNFVIRCLPQMRHCSNRHHPPQLERLISPSIDILGTFFLQPPPSEKRKAERRETAFVDILKLCDERVIARCVSRTGFFSRLVADLLNHNFDASESLFRVIVHHGFYTFIRPDDQKAIRKTFPRF
ncbi:hypothetical protein BLNAU_14459 [Blattamonas nauphoetae]|uniref:Uncharacterized protein n=1 Tax=Blattamonas nauphoetae TaxID=2049346 RepID=A0ABQ9XGV2_9EUKA|nr:hypothetical protein BLNAU_14459 [Blattamonas nauphoetae]